MWDGFSFFENVQGKKYKSYKSMGMPKKLDGGWGGFEGGQMQARKRPAASQIHLSINSAWMNAPKKHNFDPSTQALRLP